MSLHGKFPIRDLSDCLIELTPIALGTAYFFEKLSKFSYKTFIKKSRQENFPAGFFVNQTTKRI